MKNLSAIVAWFANQDDRLIDKFEVLRVFGQVQMELDHLEDLGILKCRDAERRIYRLRGHWAFQLNPVQKQPTKFSWSKKQATLKSYRDLRRAA
jgi:hypothetical protein